MEVQKNSWFTMANSTEINDLGLPWSTLIVGNLHIYIYTRIICIWLSGSWLVGDEQNIEHLRYLLNPGASAVDQL